MRTLKWRRLLDSGADWPAASRHKITLIWAEISHDYLQLPNPQLYLHTFHGKSFLIVEMDLVKLKNNDSQVLGILEMVKT